MHDEMVHGERAFRVGAKGYLVKQEATEKVIVAIRKILGGDVYLPDRLQSMPSNGLPRSAKTPIRQEGTTQSAY